MSAHPPQSGRVWRFGDNLNTDVLAPGQYMKFGIEEIARHCREAVESFAGLFYRNALNLGLPALVCAEAKRIRADDRLRVDAESGRIDNLATGETIACEPIPAHLMQMIRDGGLLPHLEKRLKQK